VAEYLTGRERLAHAAALGRWSMHPRPADARKIADRAGAVLAERNALAEQVEQLTERMAVVEKFVAARAEYITAINNCAPGNFSDYHRWQGHAEGRRQLAQELGLPVAWPPEYEPGA